MLSTGTNQIPQGPQGPHPRRRQGRHALNFGAYGLKAVEPGRVTARQIEAARRAITRHMKRVGRVWIRIFPDVPVSTQAGRSAHGQRQGRAGILGLPRSIPAASCSRSTACRATSPSGLSSWPPPSCRSRPASWPVWARRTLTMKAEELRDKTPDQLESELTELKKEQFNLRFQQGQRPAREHRRGCARCGATSPASRPS